MKIGLISDTHGLLRPEAAAALAGCAHILHAGDIGSPAVLSALAEIAPVSAIRGNNDDQPWAAPLPETLQLELGGRRLLMTHDLKSLGRDPTAEGFELVVSGHSHKPLAERRGGVLYLNPGSAGPRRFSLPITLGLLELDGGHIAVRLLRLDEGRWTPLATL